jgi:alpha-N-arabinofuranosidase
MTRRQFIQKTALATAVALTTPAARADSTEHSIEILLGEPIGTISPDLYGHFTEHIGGVIYDGIWVGEDSKIPNEGGIRKQLIEAMRQLKPSVVRWPGGCFADSYNWRDGIGPRAQRPRRTNFWINEPFLQRAPDGPAKYDPNQFGTNEFVHFCKAIGAHPYLAVNLRSNTARDFYEWVDYCNAPAGQTTLSAERAATGYPEPFGVRFWGIGNESWGCGGNFTPEEYATEFRRFTAWVPSYGVPLAFVGSGPNGGDLDWTRKFLTKLTERDAGLLNLLHGWAMHYYCGTAGKGDAIDFTVADWYELLGKSVRMEQLITNHWAAMGEVDHKHRVKLIVDEWGAWHRPGTEVAPTHLFGQTSTLRDALISGLTLDIFNRHADKVAMANVAQLINNLHSLFLAVEDKFVATPNFYVFKMYAAHHHGQSLRTVFNLPPLKESKSPALSALAGSASLKDRRLVLTVVNPSTEEALEARVVIRGGKVKGGNGQLVTADDIHAHDTFEQPHAVVTQPTEVRVSDGEAIHKFPRASVTCLEFELA